VARWWEGGGKVESVSARVCVCVCERRKGPGTWTGSARQECGKAFFLLSLLLGGKMKEDWVLQRALSLSPLFQLTLLVDPHLSGPNMMV